MILVGHAPRRDHYFTGRPPDRLDGVRAILSRFNWSESRPVVTDVAVLLSPSSDR
jgi:hypothetical protein